MSVTKNKSQTLFWLDSVFYLSLFEGLESFLNNISLFLDNKAGQLKDNEPIAFEDDNEEGEYSFAIEQYGKLFPVLLCNSFIIVLVSTLERELSKYCESVAKANDIKIKLSDLKGKRSFHEQFKDYLSEVAKFPLDFGDTNWNDIKGLIEVRNTIVHNGGVVKDDRRGRAVRSFNQRYQTLNLKGTVVHPTIPFCNKMIELVHSFLKSLTKAAYEYYK